MKAGMMAPETRQAVRGTAALLLAVIAYAADEVHSWALGRIIMLELSQSDDDGHLPFCGRDERCPGEGRCR